MISVTGAYKQDLDASIRVSVGKGLQICLFVFPVLLLLAWALGIDDMNLCLDTFEIVIIFLGVFITNYTIATGKCNYLHGHVLLSLYGVIG